MNPGAVILKCLATAFPSLKIEQLKDINTMYTINTVSYLKMQTGKWEWWHFLCRSQWYFTLHVCLTIQTGISSFLQGMGMSVWGKSNNWFKKTNKQTHLFMTQLSKLFFSSFFFFFVTLFIFLPNTCREDFKRKQTICLPYLLLSLSFLHLSLSRVLP